MITLLSPAKSLDLSAPAEGCPYTQPQFLGDTRKLVRRARQLKAQDLRKLMGISETLAELNATRFKKFKSPRTPGEAKQAALAFSGDVYQGLDAATLGPDALDFAQQHLRILSGLYGLLRPLDLIYPYRLEMGTSLDNERGKNLYQFWGDKLAKQLKKDLKDHQSSAVVNLASGEYFKAVPKKALGARVVTPVFQEVKDGVPKVISFVAKRSRGMMARWIAEQQLDDPEGLKDFKVADYRFQKKDSTEDKLVFRRKHRTLANPA